MCTFYTCIRIGTLIKNFSLLYQIKDFNDYILIFIRFYRKNMGFIDILALNIYTLLV